jgi:hypothetical protein
MVVEVEAEVEMVVVEMAEVEMVVVEMVEMVEAEMVPMSIISFFRAVLIVFLTFTTPISFVLDLLLVDNTADFLFRFGMLP